MPGTVSVLPHLLRWPPRSEHHPNRRGALAESLKKRAQRRRKQRQKANECQKQHWTVSIGRETKQSRTLLLRKKPRGNLSVAKQDFHSLEKVAREQIPADDTGTGGGTCGKSPLQVRNHREHFFKNSPVGSVEVLSLLKKISIDASRNYTTIRGAISWG